MRTIVTHASQQTNGKTKRRIHCGLFSDTTYLTLYYTVSQAYLILSL